MNESLERIARVEENQKWVMQNISEMRAMLERSLSERGEAHERVLSRIGTLEVELSAIRTKIVLAGVAAGVAITALWDYLRAKFI